MLSLANLTIVKIVIFLFTHYCPHAVIIIDIISTYWSCLIENVFKMYWCPSVRLSVCLSHRWFLRGASHMHVTRPFAAHKAIPAKPSVYDVPSGMTLCIDKISMTWPVSTHISPHACQGRTMRGLQPWLKAIPRRADGQKFFPRWPWGLQRVLITYMWDAPRKSHMWFSWSSHFMSNKCTRSSPGEYLSVIHFFCNISVIVSWNFQDLLPLTKVMFMQKVKVRGQRSRSKMKTQFGLFRTVTSVWIHI